MQPPRVTNHRRVYNIPLIDQPLSKGRSANTPSGLAPPPHLSPSARVATNRCGGVVPGVPLRSAMCPKTPVH
eukprot:3945873-Pleurochrysis_carterae.AAC.1